MWSGDYLIVDANALNDADSAQQLRLLRVKDLVVPDYFVFPIATGAIKQPENQRRLQDFEPDDDGMPIPFDAPPQSEVEAYLRELEYSEAAEAPRSPDLSEYDFFIIFLL